MASFSTRMVGSIVLAACLTASKGRLFTPVVSLLPQPEWTRMSTFMGTRCHAGRGRRHAAREASREAGNVTREARETSREAGRRHREAGRRREAGSRYWVM